ncbi:type II toxin-antitoxin system HicB family antitoxin [Streptomyces sp. NPDC047046]|uniref:type II toxin-antitoxin system HicB family antitoxin n=1 Tax=Streptomyces sp. NPDC047046 TaxID=3155378 RepID=UPI00340C14EF
MHTYPATATRDGNWWAVEIHGLPENHIGFTQGRTWKQAQEMAVDATALLLDIPAEEIAIELEPSDPVAARAIRDAEDAAREAARAEEVRRNTLAASARALTRRGISVRDAARMLGISYQRVSQLAPRTGRAA